MTRARFDVDADIRRAKSPPSALYNDRSFFERQRRKVFPRAWHLLSHGSGLEEPGSARPVTLLDGCLDEPLLLVRDLHGELHCLSNVCTHRANLIVEGEWTLDSLRCKYHGRRFHLDGTFAFMPGFEKAEGFPSEKDYLPRIPIAAWRGLLFTSLAPTVSAEETVAPIEKRLEGLGVADWTLEPAASYELDIEANWVLYNENALEGLHLPHVHRSYSGKDGVLSPETELWDQGSLQIDHGVGDGVYFDLPEDHPDYGQRIAAYHFWLFPTTFLAIYPWGLALNSVQPVGRRRTRVRFLSFVSREGSRHPGTLDGLRRAAEEDAVVVQNVQRGVRSRLFRGGRYSPSAEKCVHHFHRLLASWMAGGKGAR
jgi:choline monooxygenase